MKLRVPLYQHESRGPYRTQLRLRSALGPERVHQHDAPSAASEEADHAT